MPDHLQLSARGYRLWAEAMEPSVKALLGER
jgi:lysophospholipase L1-like esterase